MTSSLRARGKKKVLMPLELAFPAGVFAQR